MPRISTSTSDPLDFCNRHMPSEKNARARYANLGDGPDGRGNCFEYDTEHPSYDYAGYCCYSCGCTLTDDNA